MSVSFVSYDGAFPNLCAGTLVLKVEGKPVTFPRHSLVSGGRVWICGGDAGCEYGPWDVYAWPEEIPVHLRARCLQVINDNVREGCCGGCI